MDARVIVSRAEGGIDRAAWSRFAANLDPRLDPRWFSLNEGEISAESRCVSVWRGDRLSAIAPCIVSLEGGPGFIPHRATDILFQPDRIHDADLKLDRPALEVSAKALCAVSLFPSIAVATPCSAYAPTGDLLCRAEDDLEIFERALPAIEALAAGISARLWAILGVRADSPLLARAEEYGFLPALIAADTTIKVPWASFDDYLGSLGSRRRYATRWELARAKERGIEFSREPDPAAIVDAQVRLMLSHLESLGHVGDAETERSYLLETIRQFGDDYRIIAARRQGELIGFCSFLSSGRHHKVMDCCVDRSKADRDDQLFPTLMSETIRLTIALGGGVITFGSTNFRAKLHRGCSLQPLWGLYRPIDASTRSALANHLSVFNRAQSDAFAPLAAFENPTRPGAGRPSADHLQEHGEVGDEVHRRVQEDHQR